MVSGLHSRKDAMITEHDVERAVADLKHQFEKSKEILSSYVDAEKKRRFGMHEAETLALKIFADRSGTKFEKPSHSMLCIELMHEIDRLKAEASVAPVVSTTTGVWRRLNNKLVALVDDPDNQWMSKVLTDGTVQHTRTVGWLQAVVNDIGRNRKSLFQASIYCYAAKNRSTLDWFVGEDLEALKKQAEEWMIDLCSAALKIKEAD